MRQSRSELNTPHGIKPTRQADARKPDKGHEECQPEQPKRAEAEPVAAETPVTEPRKDDVEADDRKDRHQPRPQPFGSQSEASAHDRALQTVELGVPRRRASQHRFIIHVLRLNSSTQDDGQTKACEQNPATCSASLRFGSAKPVRQAVEADQLFVGLARAHGREPVAVDQHLGDEQTGIVGAGLHGAIGAGGVDR